MNETVRLHQAKRTDLTMINDMLIQTVLWLQSQGSSQWSGILEGQDNHNTAEAINRGEVFYGTINSQTVGMFILWDHQSKWDSSFWGVDKSTDFFYLHRLTIIRAFSGQGISSKLLNEAKIYAKSKGKKAIRLDCIADNQYLNKLYQNAGFVNRGKITNIITDNQKKDFNLYQYDLK